MAKLRDLITESKFLNREFGEPLPTFKGVMKQHQVNKLEEGWWEDMSPEQQAAYIQKHPGSQQAADAQKEKGMDRASDLAKKGLTKGPGGYGDRGNVRGQDQAYFGEPDDEEYFKSMMGGDEDDEESSGRTGKELDQETLTIDGKQYRRISEGVEKQSKPKYEFSEFYERFKR